MITEYLINKLKMMSQSFTYKNENYILENRGTSHIYGGGVSDSYLYWHSNDSPKVIVMICRMKKNSDNSYHGVDKIYNVTFWESYEEGIMLDEIDYAENY